MVEYGGEPMTVPVFAARAGVSTMTVRRKLARGMSADPIVREAGPTGRREDLTGRVFGRLTVVRWCPEDPRKRWLCTCVCGASRMHYGYDLVSGTTKSCGQRGCRTSVAPDLRGRKFGLLTVVEPGRIETDTHSVFAWICRCACGSWTKVRPASLRKGATCSCGCRIGGRKRYAIFGQWLTVEEVAQVAGVSVSRTRALLRRMSPVDVLRVTAVRRPGPQKGSVLRRYRWRDGRRARIADICRKSGWSSCTVIAKLRTMTPEEVVAVGPCSRGPAQGPR
jgi:hypothetical protein